MKVLALGLPRSGTASMAEALTILGYKDVFHGIKAIDNSSVWSILSRAADATFPNLPSYTGKAFTRDQWDEMYGSCEATTDLASLFAPQLVNVYPDAKVVLVIRDFDKWQTSMSTIVDQLWNLTADFAVNYVEPLIGSVTGPASRKMMLGYFQASTPDEMRQNMRQTYDRHHRVLREIVPANQLLEYRLEEGWEPLCRFLGKPVPDTGFPWVNEQAALKEVIRQKVHRQLKAAGLVILPWAVGFVALGAAVFTAKRTGHL